MNLPELEAGIRTLTQTYEINRIIDVLKAQQKIVRLMEASKKKARKKLGKKSLRTDVMVAGESGLNIPT